MYHSFLIHSFTDGHLGWFQHLAIVNCAAMNVGVHGFFWIDVSGFWGYNPTSGIAGWKGSSILRFLRKFHTVFHVAAPVCIPTNSAKGFPFLYILTGTCLLINIDGSHSDRRKVISQFYFIIFIRTKSEFPPTLKRKGLHKGMNTR